MLVISQHFCPSLTFVLYQELTQICGDHVISRHLTYVKLGLTLA